MKALPNLSLRRTLETGQRHPQQDARLTGIFPGATTVDFVFDRPITTGSGTIMGTCFKAFPVEDVETVAMTRTNPTTLTGTFSDAPLCIFGWIADGADWRTDSNGRIAENVGTI